MSIHRLGWGLLVYFALQASYEAVVYLARGPAGFDELFRAKYTLHLPLILLHGFSGVVALVAGLPQFLPGTRRMHRGLGRTYMLAVLLAGLTGVPMALMAFGGPVAQVGFLVFNLLWLVTAGLAWSTARARRFAAHRRWMIRNYALTFGAVLIRLMLHELQHHGLTFEEIYPASGWLAWGAGLTVAELCLIRGGKPWA